MLTVLLGTGLAIKNGVLDGIVFHCGDAPSARGPVCTIGSWCWRCALKSPKCDRVLCEQGCISPSYHHALLGTPQHLQRQGYEVVSLLRPIPHVYVIFRGPYSQEQILWIVLMSFGSAISAWAYMWCLRVLETLAHLFANWVSLAAARLFTSCVTSVPGLLLGFLCCFLNGLTSLLLQDS